MTQNQNRSPTTTETSKTKKLNIPQVRYHPSIQLPPGVARTPPNIRTRTRTSQNQSTRPLTGTKAAQQNQEVNATNSELRPDCEDGRRQNLKPEPAQSTDPDPVQRSEPKPSKKSELVPKPKPVQKPGAAGDGSSGGTRPVPEEVPLGVGGHLDRCVVEQVEVLTRGQRTNPHWFSWRKNRITASVAHSIAHSRFANGRTQTPPTSYLNAITGEAKRVQTRAMSWGVQMEAEAVRRYQVLKTSMLGRRVSVRDCGLFVDACRPWLAGTPDGIVTDDSSGEWLLCLEVKCPYKHRERRVEDACRDDPRFCLQIENEDALQPAQSPVYRLKTSHSYYTQIQVQLAVTGLQRAELVVFTLKETAVVPVTFDPELWEETVSKLERFYRDAVLPRIREKKQENAVWTPEL